LNYITKAYIRISYAWNRFRGRHSKWEKGFWEKVAEEKKKEYLRGKEEVSKRLVTWVTGISRDYMLACYMLGLGEAGRVCERDLQNPGLSVESQIEETQKEIAQNLDNICHRFSERLRGCLRDGKFAPYP
jgi:hypothetical protein